VLYSEGMEKDWKEKHEDWAKRYRGNVQIQKIENQNSLEIMHHF